MNGEFHKTLRHGLSAIRWALAPMYLGLALMVLVLLVQFVRDFFRLLPELFQQGAIEGLPTILSLGIVLLTAQAIVLVLQTGHQVFGPSPRTDDAAQAGGRLDFTTLRNRLLSAILIIALVMVLRLLLSPAGPDKTDLWQTGGFLGLLTLTALVLAIADWFQSLAHKR